MFFLLLGFIKSLHVLLEDSGEVDDEFGVTTSHLLPWKVQTDQFIVPVDANIRDSFLFIFVDKSDCFQFQVETVEFDFVRTFYYLKIIIR